MKEGRDYTLEDIDHGDTVMEGEDDNVEEIDNIEDDVPQPPSDTGTDIDRRQSAATGGSFTVEQFMELFREEAVTKTVSDT